MSWGRGDWLTPRPVTMSYRSMSEKHTELIERAEEILGYRFRDGSLLIEALTHSSCADDALESNERMEFLGDAVLGFVVCDFLYQRYGELREGDLTKIKSSVVSRRVCAMVSDAMGLTELLKLGKGMEGRNDLPSSVSAAVFESVVAAIYLDGGLDTARAFLMKYVTEPIEQAEASAHQHNFKSALQQYAQRDLNDLPTYILLDEKGPDHSKCFEVCVEINGQRYPSAWGGNKKEAEQSAAMNALLALGLLGPEEVENLDVFEAPGERG